MSDCTCPTIDGCRIRKRGCPEHGAADAAVLDAKAAERADEARREVAVDMACAWSDFRRDFGVSSDKAVRRAEHRAFQAGYEAARAGDQSAVTR